jgi:hypothetical protein
MNWVDEEPAGDPYWVDCVGGPYDGQMVQMTRARLTMPDGTVNGLGRLPMSFRRVDRLIFRTCSKE